MEYVYAALILNETDEEINEENLTAVLEAAGVDVEESRVKALVAALEDVDIDEAVADATAIPASVATPTGDEDEPAAEEAAEDAEESDAGDDDDDEEDDASGEGLGALFG